MKVRTTLVVAVILMCACTALSQTRTTGKSEPYHLVSLIRVIAAPNELDGHHVKLVGFLSRGGGLDRAVGLFVSEADGRNLIVPNSVDLKIDESKLKNLMGSYVGVSGTYHAPDPRAGYNGYLDEIVDVKPLRSGE